MPWPRKTRQVLAPASVPIFGVNSFQLQPFADHILCFFQFYEQYVDQLEEIFVNRGSG